MIEKFKTFLKTTNYSENTKTSYLFAIQQYSQQYEEVTQENIERASELMKNAPIPNAITHTLRTTPLNTRFIPFLLLIKCISNRLQCHLKMHRTAHIQMILRMHLRAPAVITADAHLRQ